jgi:hypothetical protein
VISHANQEITIESQPTHTIQQVAGRTLRATAESKVVRIISIPPVYDGIITFDVERCSSFALHNSYCLGLFESIDLLFHRVAQ